MIRWVTTYHDLQVEDREAKTETKKELTRDWYIFSPVNLAVTVQFPHHMEPNRCSVLATRPPRLHSSSTGRLTRLRNGKHVRSQNLEKIPVISGAVLI